MSPRSSVSVGKSCRGSAGSGPVTFSGSVTGGVLTPLPGVMVVGTDSLVTFCSGEGTIHPKSKTKAAINKYARIHHQLFLADWGHRDSNPDMQVTASHCHISDGIWSFGNSLSSYRKKVSAVLTWLYYDPIVDMV